jgi:dTDP-4-amino-4,6-dideoxygalactose transaminase
MAGPGSYLIGTEETNELLDVMSSGYLSRYGDLNDQRFRQKVYQFERASAAYFGVDYAVATSSGTSALFISLLAMGLEPGDEVIVPGYTFVASYSAIIFAGGVPVLAEIDESLTLDPNDIEKRITPRTKFIMPVHMLGNPCDMDLIMDIAWRHNLKVIEDCCQAAGAEYNGRKCGTIGDMGAFSLNVFKTITAGDGGFVLTNDRRLYERAFGIHDQGHTPNRAGIEVGERSVIGFNFRINEVTGALALAQLRKIDTIVTTLRSKKALLKETVGLFPRMKYRTINDPAGECATLLTLILDGPQDAQRVCAALKTKTISSSGWHVYSNMEHISEYLKKVGQPHGKGALPRTDDLLARSVNISVGVVDAGLGSGFGININSTPDDIRNIGQIIRRALGSELSAKKPYPCSF